MAAQAAANGILGTKSLIIEPVTITGGQISYWPPFLFMANGSYRI
jgi:hypothetical protein